MKGNKIIWILVFVILISPIYAMKPLDFYGRLKNLDKYPNGICDDGENLFFDDDCKIDKEMFFCKDKCIFDYMWFARFGILMALIFLVFYRKEWKVILLFLSIFLLFFFIVPPQSETKDLNIVKCIAKYNPVCVQDIDGNIEFVNECEAQKLGYQEYESGKCSDLENYLPKTDIEKFWDVISSFGARLYPSKPIIGWAVIFLMAFIGFKAYEDVDYRFRNRRRNKFD